MSADDDVLDTLRRHLSGRYHIVREIGRGGMGIVLLGREVRHDRLVAIKVLRPELAALVGSERFLREILVVAHLEHPHIVSLWDSGDVGGLPYYVMPYIEGETIHTLIQREGQLPLEDVIELTRQVASALDFAHGKGIVHRDIKPHNILVCRGQALVADFGLARALVVAGGEKLTGTGVAVGSPSYMSPEQATGADRVDHRSDIYSLGCVVYELLTGEPPFSGRTPNAVIARHISEPVPDLRVVRSTVSAGMERAVKRALAKVPADRFRTASAFAEALRAGRELAPAEVAPRGRAPGPRFMAAIAAGALMLASGAAMLRIGERGDSRVESKVGTVAVLPFQWSGMVDSAILTQRGMIELLSSKLGGTPLLRTVDPALVMRRWDKTGAQNALTERGAIRIAAELGADLTLLGSVHGTSSGLVVGGSLHSSADGTLLYRIEDMTGPADSVVGLLDRFVASILLYRAGERRRSEDLGTGALESVKAYVSGLEEYRRGRFAAAASEFERALRADPGFALARLWLGIAHRTGDNIESELAVLSEAWKERHRLPRSDSLLLVALVGRRHPEPTPAREQLEMWEWVADSLPQQWQGAYELGDMLFHWGPALGSTIPHTRAAVAFRQSMRTDSLFAPALEHLIDLAALQGDEAEVRRLAEQYLAANPDAEGVEYVRWRVAATLGDSAALRRIRAGFAQLNRGTLEQIIATSQLDGIVIDDAVAGVAELRRRARNEYDLSWMGLLERELALNRGRPRDVPREREDAGFTLPLPEFSEVIEALYWTGDEELARRIVTAWQPEVDALTDPGGGPAAPVNMKRCAVSLWRLAHRERLDLVARSLERMRSVKGAELATRTMYLPVCTAAVGGLHAALSGDSGSVTARAQLDSLLRTGPLTNAYIQLAARHVLADLLEQSGDAAGALGALGLRPYYQTFGVVGLSDLLLREGDLATRAGDTLKAVRSYEHFLALRADAEPRFRYQTERVRNELAKLGHGSTNGT